MGNNEDTNEYEKKKIHYVLLDCQLPGIDRIFQSFQKVFNWVKHSRVNAPWPNYY